MSRVPLIFVACVAAFCPAVSAISQEDERVFQPGEVVKVGIGQTVKIIQCRPERVSREIECQFVLWKNGGAASIKNWMNSAQIAAGETRVKDAEELAAMGDAPTDLATAPAPGPEMVPPATDPAAPE